MTAPIPENDTVTVRVTIPVEGADVGDEITVPADRAKFLVSNGYVARVGTHTDDVSPTASYQGDEDPTLAKNREKADAEVPGVGTKTVEPKSTHTSKTSAKQDRTGKASGVKSA